MKRMTMKSPTKYMEELHQYRLISWLTLSQDGLGVDLDVSSTRRHLWIFQHFGHLEIQNYMLYYQVNNWPRQRKNTVHPVRQMKKKFQTLFEMLAYLDLKRYDIRYFKIEFTNGWVFKEQPYINLHLITSSTEERNELLTLLFALSAIKKPDLCSLKNGSTYRVVSDTYGQEIEEFVFDL